jgi:hypothetical protein
MIPQKAEETDQYLEDIPKMAFYTYRWAIWAFEHFLSVSVVSFICYLTLVRSLRLRRIQKLERRFAKYIKDPYSMDYKVAHEVVKLHMLDEQQYLTMISTQWALIRTFAVASGTKLLDKTNQLSSPANVGKRAEDTSLLLVEMMLGDLDSKRSMTAVAKVNWLHAKYKKHIKNDDMIFTLSEFIIEPIKFINQWGWRRLTRMEEVARFVLWREIGNRMGIQDIPDTLEQLKEWLGEFEAREMAYADSNANCANSTLELFLRGVPGFLHRPMHGIARALMEPRVNEAIGWRPAPLWAVVTVNCVFKFRGWAILHLALPRFSAMELPKVSKDGRIYRTEYLFEPWYFKQDAWSCLRVYFGSWGRVYTGHEFGSSGYLPEELGPTEYIEKSREAVLKQTGAMEEYVKENKGGGCPFDFGGELKWVKDEVKTAN